MSVRVIQISDIHLSTVHRHFVANVEAVRRHVAAAGADLVIDTGDLTMNGAGEPADLASAAAWHASLGTEWRAVPGNHDIGDLPSRRPDQPIGEERLAAWHGAIGADHWYVDVEGWRLIGIDAMLLGSGLAEEEDQYRWLDEVTETTAAIALFLHKPLFLERIDEGARSHWTVPPAARARLTGALVGADLRLVASGHLHAARMRTVAGVSHVWCPSSAFVSAAIDEDFGGERSIGIWEHVFSGGRVESRWVRPAGVVDALIDPVHDLIYPPTVAASAG